MAESTVHTTELEELIQKIWVRGVSRGSYEREAYGKSAAAALKHNREHDCPRFCIDPDFGELRFNNKEVTHYDFEWKELGKTAVLKLYQGRENGEVIYGAVMSRRIKRIGGVTFTWVEEGKSGKFVRRTKKK